MAVGGGLDIAIAEHVALRPIQFDYFMTRYEWKALGINNQSNFNSSVATFSRASVSCSAALSLVFCAAALA